MAKSTKVLLVAPSSLNGGRARAKLFPQAVRSENKTNVGTHHLVEPDIEVNDISDLDHQNFNQAIISSKAQVLVMIVDCAFGLEARDSWVKILSSLAAIPRVILAIDNMALCNWSQERFEELSSEFIEQVNEYDIDELTVVPVDFLSGELLQSSAHEVKWYLGQPLLEVITSQAAGGASQAVKIETEEADQLAAHIYWLHAEPMLPGRHYELKYANAELDVSISDLKFRINSQAQYQQAAKQLQRGEIGYVNLSLDEAISFSPFEQDRDLGYFELFDKQSGVLVGLCMIKHGLRRATNIKWQEMEINKSIRAKAMGQKPCILWFTGLSGSGKSTIANIVEKKLHQKGIYTYALDGDNIRHGLCRDLGFTDADRVENLRRISETAKLFVDAGIVVLASFISPFRSERQESRELFEDDEFLEVFVDTSLEVCESRDVKGLYKLARAGELKNFTGLDSPYEAPENAEINLAGGELAADVLADQVIEVLEKRGLI